MASVVCALSGDVGCLAVLHEGLRGRVHSIFARVINVIVPGGTLLTLASRDVDDAPDTLVVNLRSFDDHGVAIGDPVETREGVLVVGEHLAIRLDSVRQWAPLLPRYPPHETLLRRNLDAVREHIAALGNQGSASGPPTSAVAITASALVAQRAAALGHALAGGDLEEALAQGEALVGLGPGLTPSGDDVLVGLLAVLHLPSGPCESFVDFGRQIVARAAQRTHAISLAALQAAADGRVRSRIIALLAALTAGGRAETLAALRPVLAIGSTSGRDIVAGIVLGFEAQLHHAWAQRRAA